MDGQPVRLFILFVCLFLPDAYQGIWAIILNIKHLLSIFKIYISYSRLACRLGLAGLFAFAFLGCNRVSQGPDPAPSRPLPTSLARLTLTTNSQGFAEVRLDTLAQASGLRFTFGTFAHGELLVADQGRTLRYQVTDTSRTWKADSADFTACLTDGSRCRNGKLIVNNARYQAPTPVDSTCHPLSLPVRYVPLLGTATMRWLPAGLTGRIFTRNLFYTLNRSTQDTMAFVYVAAGGAQDVFAGFDDIEVDVRASDGKRYCGIQSLVIGDTCQPRARADAFNILPTGTTYLTAASLWTNDTGCRGTTDRFVVRLAPRPYTGALRLPTLYGTVTDTLLGNTQVLAYRRTRPGTEPDRFYYYLESTTTRFVSRAWITLR